MKKQKIKKLIIIIIGTIILFILNLLNILNSVQAAALNSANLFSAGECQELLKYNGIPVKVTYVKYYNGDVSYPAYCLNKELPGVTDEMSYCVSANDVITEVGLWRVIINGYPYKSIEQLGCQSEEEAFTATKQAVYCYIHGNDINAYEAIDEAGERTLNALYKIIENAENSSEYQINNSIELKTDSEKWDIDQIDNKYLSKTYSIKNTIGISKYKIELSDLEEEMKNEILITDNTNKESNEFSSNETFKILIPIDKMIENGSFNINVSGSIRTKPVLYGISPDSNYQDYALTCATYEESTKNLIDNYDKNETQIKIIKQDEENKKRLEGVEFELNNENKENICKVKTNEKGEIEIKNLIPGKYFLKEIKTIDGYYLNNEEIEIILELNEKKEVLVNNNKIKISTNVETPKEEVKKLPVTGM